MPALTWFSRLASSPFGEVFGSRSAQRNLAVATLVAQAGISVTGSIVRVTGSGLGCPTWPQCFPGSMVPVSHPEVALLHQWIEYGNRLLTGVVGITSALCLLAALLGRPRRPRLVRLAATMPIGVVVQAVVGGITVLTRLSWWTVCLHFLLSIVLVWLATLLVRAVNEGDEPARPVVPVPLRGLLAVISGVLAALLVAGTLVTAAGPHAGDADVPRLDLPILSLAQLHADLLFLYLGMLVALGFALRIGGATPPRVWRRYRELLAAVVAQGALGMVQYWTGVPEVLVPIHVLGSILVTVATAALWTATRDRGPHPEAPVPSAQQPTADTSGTVEAHSPASVGTRS